MSLTYAEKCACGATVDIAGRDALAISFPLGSWHKAHAPCRLARTERSDVPDPAGATTTSLASPLSREELKARREQIDELIAKRINDAQEGTLDLMAALQLSLALAAVFDAARAGIDALADRDRIDALARALEGRALVLYQWKVVPEGESGFSIAELTDDEIEGMKGGVLGDEPTLRELLDQVHHLSPPRSGQLQAGER